MKKILIRIVSLLLVFIAAAFAIGKFINRDTPDTTETMSKATFPLVYMTIGDKQMNSLHGYKKEMDVTAMRDSLTPLNGDRQLVIQIEPFQNKIKGVSFEVITADGKKSMEKTKVTKIEQDEHYVTATLDFHNKMLINTEYMLKIQVTTGSRDLYYYTRIIQQDGLNTERYLDFANGFYERCLNGNAGGIAEYIETSDEGDNTTFAFMDIYCTPEQLCWESLKPQIYYKPIPSIKELNATTATIVMDYMISATNDEGEVEIYNVSEYYRMRFTDARILLLDFERTTHEIFNPASNVLEEKGIRLGIVGRSVSYKNDKENNYFAFVQEGALWLYEVSTSKITQVFSFPQSEDSDGRDTYNQNEINIINIDSDGNIYFLICGYMNRGIHEGESGIAVYYYDNPGNSIHESLFVDTKQSYSLLKEDVSSLAYVTEDRSKFCIMISGQVYSIDLNTREAESLVSGVRSRCFVSSGSGKQFAWLKENEAFHSKTLNIIDLDTKEVRNITCGEKERIRPIGFIDEDLVYGIADAADINTEHEGNEVFPMKKVVIVNQAGEIVKEYAPEGMYVMEAFIEEKLLTMERATKDGEGFQEAAEDHIVNSVPDEESSYGLTTMVTERKQTETILRVGTSIKASAVPQIIRSRHIIYEGSKSLVLNPEPRKEEVYYVYAKGHLDSIYSSANVAITRADETLGVVVDSSQQHIWERGNKKTKIDLDINSFPGAVMQFQMDAGQLQSSLNKTVLDLSGCTLDMVLYFVSEGLPVLAKIPDGVVAIGGYDQYNTRLLYPGETELKYYGLDDSQEMFEQAGNVFMTYLDPPTE